MPAKGFRKKHCKRGHSLDENNRNSQGDCIECSRIVQKTWLENPENKKRQKQHQKNWRTKNREEEAKRNRQYRKGNPEAVQNTQLKRRYGITLAERNDQLTKQDNKCAICRTEFDEAHKPETDHDHATQSVRGQLCHACNVMLGQAKDNIETLAHAIVYLKETQKCPSI